MKKIILVNQTANYLFADIVAAFARRCAGRRIEAWYGTFDTDISTLPDNVSLRRGPAYDRSSIIRRLVSWLRFYRWMRRHIRAEDPRTTHFFFVSNPPLFVFLPGLQTLSYECLLYDLYPHVLGGRGRLAGLLSAPWARKKAAVLPHARRIYTISEAMKRVVCAGLPSSAHAKVKVVPLWADHSHGNELSARDLRAEWGLAGKKVLLYAGNLGITHPLKALLGLAKRLEHDDQWRLLIVGRGPQRDALEQHATDYRNVIWKDPVPSSDRPNLLALATWGGVLLDSKAGTASVPSKTYNLLAAGIPLLAIVPDDSEVAALVNDQRVGLCAAETEIEPLAAKLAAVTAAEHEAFAKQARDCSRRYDPALAESFTVACGQPEPVFAGVEVPRAT